MPIAIIRLMEGRDQAKKKALIENVSKAISESLDAPLASVRVLIEELPAEHWGVGGVPASERPK